MKYFFRTGQRYCFDSHGKAIQCANAGQDGEIQSGVSFPEPRFVVENDLVTDRLTKLIWTRRAAIAEFPLTWQESLDAIEQMNVERAYGRSDWRLPNRRELRSLVDHGQTRPVLPADHPFTDLVQHWYWTSTSSAMSPAYAWHVHFMGGRMFYGKKDGYELAWPVAGSSDVIPKTGQRLCYDTDGNTIDCSNTGQDGAIRTGVAWPDKRFEDDGEIVRDDLTGLIWARHADLAGKLVNLDTAYRWIADYRQKTGRDWRLPSINELESLVDASGHSPALPSPHPFLNPREAYWSSTTSTFEPDWSYCLYLHKGAVGVGFKVNAEFSVWPVCQS
ncbi:DUF1566 domain-containing protein [Desulfovibrio inopinatus]|uniref:Lcl C-terminal domain-containing protein n=1 Tax=Desulfovibrio inopinatus TaxID=102109 RepID=UPI00040B2F34|nr:DUF1566 domain-containing protein [Desulfovibrio inopinatus]